MSHVAVFKLYNSGTVDMFRPGHGTCHTSAESSGRLKTALYDAISMMIKRKPQALRPALKLALKGSAAEANGEVGPPLAARHANSRDMKTPASTLFEFYSVPHSAQGPRFSDLVSHLLGLHNPQRCQIKALKEARANG